MAAVISIDPTTFGATVTTTVTTTQTATLGQVIYLTIPTPATPPPLQYTSIPFPTLPDQKQYPSGLPILVLTQVNNVIIDPSGNVLETATIVQGPPPVGPTLPSGQKVILVPPVTGWRSWTAGEQAGVIVAAVFLGVGLIATGIWVCCVHRRRRKVEREAKKRHRDGRRGSRHKKEKSGVVALLLKQLFDGSGSRGRSGGLRNGKDVEDGERRSKKTQRTRSKEKPVPAPQQNGLANPKPEPRRDDWRFSSGEPLTMSGGLGPSQQVPQGERPLRPPRPSQQRDSRENVRGQRMSGERQDGGRIIRSEAIRDDRARQENEATQHGPRIRGEVSMSQFAFS
ncbi:hypothetical protein MMC06_000870 [Schaereria dolodes]|nr:hypothetical protein [Schaereria dolodes]